MFSGKTEELLRRIKRAKIAQQSVVLVKPKIDKRYSEVDIVTHEGRAEKAIPIEDSSWLLQNTSHASVVAIDEAQFFDDQLPAICTQLADDGKRVIVAGLDMDFKGIPFGPVPSLLAIAEYVSKVHAVCMDCGHLAQFSHRKTEIDPQIMLGAQGEYEPLCRTCFNQKNK